MAPPRPTIKIEINRSALTKYLQRGEEPQAALKAVAEALNAKVDEKSEVFRNTGHHAVRTYVRKYRYGYQVVNGDTFSFIIEFGSKNNPAYRPMTSAAREMFGGAFTEQDKPEAGDGDG